MLKNFRLRTKVIILVTISAFFLISLVFFTTYFYLNTKLVNERLADIQKINIEQVHESNQIFKNNYLFAKMLGTRTRVVEYLSLPTEAKRIELLDIFSTYSKEDSKYLSLYLLDKNGKAVISTDPTFVGKDYSFRDYYKKGMLGEPFVDILLGKTTNQFGYYFSYPVFDNNKNVLGVFVSKINDEEISSVILNSEVSKNGTVMLVDKYGIVVTSNLKERFLNSLGNLNTEEKDILNKSEKFFGKEIRSLQYDQAQEIIRRGAISESIKVKDEVDGDDEILNIIKVGDFPFYIVTETGLENIGATILNTIIILVGMILLAVVISTFLLYKSISYSLRPIKILESFTKEIASGSFSKRINLNTKDEFGDLGESLNKMADNLEDLYNNLDKKVKERTEELEKSEMVLSKTLEDSKRMNNLMVGREIEMIKLKKEIADIKNIK